MVGAAEAVREKTANEATIASDVAEEVATAMDAQ